MEINNTVEMRANPEATSLASSWVSQTRLPKELQVGKKSGEQNLRETALVGNQKFRLPLEKVSSHSALQETKGFSSVVIVDQQLFVASKKLQ